MSISQFLEYIHWAVYLLSIASFLLLLTRFRAWGALWIAILFITQGLFRGCLLVDVQNYFKLQEGLQPRTNEMLTKFFTDSIVLQIIFSCAIACAALYIIWDNVHRSKGA